MTTFATFAVAQPVGGTAAATEEGRRVSLEGERRTFHSYEATASASAQNWSVQETRPTTDRERLIATLRRFVSLGENWDGEGAGTPNVASVRAASHFACALTDSYLTPEPMLHASGNAGLLWDEDGLYGEIEFLSDNRAAYFFEIGIDKHKGVVQLPAVEIPPSIASLLPRA